jgi:hypothetical protein
MTADRYVLLQLQKGATIHECQDCGAVIFHRAIHDAFHEVTEREANAVAGLLARLVETQDGPNPDTAYLRAQAAASRAMTDYGDSPN